MRPVPVVIVGGGPAGLMLAIELGRRGVACILFCDKPDTSPHPQANATQARTMEHFRRLGFAREIRQLGLPASYPTDIAYFTRYAKYELARFQRPASGEAPDMARRSEGAWSTPELPHRCSQMFIEKVLRRQVESHPSVDLRFNWRVVAVDERASHVEVTAERLDGTETWVGRADYVVGCDGPHSLVRRTLGIEYAGESGVDRHFMGGRMHATYLRAPHLYDLIRGEKAWMYWAVNQERRSFMAAIDGVDRFVFHTQLKKEEERCEIDSGAARRFFYEALGAETPIDILSHSSWIAGLMLVAERYQSKRMFIAGDAAHLFTPTGGLGYNTAIDDVCNLGWKLAARVQGWGGPALLDTYESERRPIGLRNTGMARRFADSIGNYIPPMALEAEGPEGEAARREAGAYLDRHAREEFNIPGITFGVRYDNSPLIVGDGTTPPPDQINDYIPTACPGGRAPHAWFDSDVSLFDRLGRDFTLLRLGNNAPDASAFVTAASVHDVPLSILTIPSSEIRDLYEADLALVRPDHHVAWRGGEGGDAHAIVAQVTGWDT